MSQSIKRRITADRAERKFDIFYILAAVCADVTTQFITGNAAAGEK